jgi:hypothetical protein
LVSLSGSGLLSTNCVLVSGMERLCLFSSMRSRTCPRS